MNREMRLGDRYNPCYTLRCEAMESCADNRGTDSCGSFQHVLPYLVKIIKDV